MLISRFLGISVSSSFTLTHIFIEAFIKTFLKIIFGPDVVVHTYNTSTQPFETGLSSRPAWVI
jgi:hypothetical protein